MLKSDGDCQSGLPTSPRQVMHHIVYVGSSGDAMLGAKAVKNPKPTGRLSD